MQDLVYNQTFDKLVVFVCVQLRHGDLESIFLERVGVLLVAKNRDKIAKNARPDHYHILIITKPKDMP
jgi:hypothetical protein